MTEQECLAKMIAPGQVRPSKPYRGGVIQVHVTRACNQACFHCTQGSNFGGKAAFMPPEMFRQACRSLKGYFGVVGMFGGNPATHPQFRELCAVMREEVPADQRGLWCNDPMTLENAVEMRRTFAPGISNLNVHLDQKAFDLFKQGWPECNPVGLTQDSRHGPVFLAMKDVVWTTCPTCQNGGAFSSIDCPTCQGKGIVRDNEKIWELISGCDINQKWSAMVGMFRSSLRAWFCEVAGAQSILHQDEPDYPDTGFDPTDRYYKGKIERDDAIIYTVNETVAMTGVEEVRWWQMPIYSFASQVRKHCFDCGVPLRGRGELAMAQEGVEQVSAAHAEIAKPKRRGRQVVVVDSVEQLGVERLGAFTNYIGNARS